MLIPEPYVWLVVIFMREIYEEMPASDAMLKAFEAAGTAPGNRVLLVREAARVKKGKMNYSLQVCRLDRVADGTFTWVPDPAGEKNRMDALAGVFARYPASRKLLLTYGHGSAFGINGEEGPGDILWMSDLAADLESCLPDSSIDAMLMVNCYMQLFDNGYLLRKKIRYLVAPQGVMPSGGYDYTRLMTYLNERPAIASEALVGKVVADYHRKYIDLGMDEYINRTTLFAVAPGNYAQAVSLFRRLLELLELRLPEIAGVLQEIRTTQMQVVSNSPGYDLVDAGHWVSLLTTRLAYMDGIRSFAEAFRSVQEKMVVAQMVGSAYTAADRESECRFGYSGISLYYPETLARWKHQDVAWHAYHGQGTHSPFSKDSGWGHFLERYFQVLD